MKFKTGDVVIVVFPEEGYILKIVRATEAPGGSAKGYEYQFVAATDIAMTKVPGKNWFDESSAIGRGAVLLKKASKQQKHDFIKLCFPPR